MKIDRIRVGKSVEVLGLWHKLDIEGVIGENENPEIAHAELKVMLDKLLPTVNGYSKEPPILEEINMNKEKTEIAIDNAMSKDELKLLMSDAWKYKLESQYLIKLKSFE